MTSMWRLRKSAVSIPYTDEFHADYALRARAHALRFRAFHRRQGEQIASENFFAEPRIISQAL